MAARENENGIGSLILLMGVIFVGFVLPAVLILVLVQLRYPINRIGDARAAILYALLCGAWLGLYMFWSIGFFSSTFYTEVPTTAAIGSAARFAVESALVLAITNRSAVSGAGPSARFAANAFLTAVVFALAEPTVAAVASLFEGRADALIGLFRDAVLDLVRMPIAIVGTLAQGPGAVLEALAQAARAASGDLVAIAETAMPPVCFTFAVLGAVAGALGVGRRDASEDGLARVARTPEAVAADRLQAVTGLVRVAIATALLGLAAGLVLWAGTLGGFWGGVLSLGGMIWFLLQFLWVGALLFAYAMKRPEIADALGVAVAALAGANRR